MRLYSIAITLLLSFDCFAQSRQDINAIDSVIKQQFSWCIQNLDSNSYKKNAQIRSNADGKTFLDVRQYLYELEKQGRVTDNFIDSERLRANRFNYFLGHVKEDSTFQMDIHKQCDFVYFFFWIFSDRDVTEIRNSSYGIKRKKAVVNTLLSGKNGSTRELTIILIKDEGVWKIDGIAKR